MQRFSASSSSGSTGASSPAASSSSEDSGEEPPCKRVRTVEAENKMPVLRNLDWNQLQSLEIERTSHCLTNFICFEMLFSGILWNHYVFFGPYHNYNPPKSFFEFLLSWSWPKAQKTEGARPFTNNMAKILKGSKGLWRSLVARWIAKDTFL